MELLQRFVLHLGNIGRLGISQLNFFSSIPLESLVIKVIFCKDHLFISKYPSWFETNQVKKEDLTYWGESNKKGFKRLAERLEKELNLSELVPMIIEQYPQITSVRYDNELT